MYLLVAGRSIVAVTYYGPFPTVRRALQYAKALPEGQQYHTVSLTVPYSVVRHIVWKDDTISGPVETNKHLNRGGA